MELCFTKWCTHGSNVGYPKGMFFLYVVELKANCYHEIVMLDSTPSQLASQLALADSQQRTNPFFQVAVF